MPSHTLLGSGNARRLALVRSARSAEGRVTKAFAHQQRVMPQVEVYGETYDVDMDAISLKEGERPTDLPGVKEAMESAVETARKDAARNGSSDATGDASDASDATADATADSADGSTYTRAQVQDVVQRMRDGDPDAHQEFQKIKQGTVSA